MKDNGIIFGLGAAAIVAAAGVVRQRGSSARGSSARQEWVPKDLAAVPSGYLTSIPFDKAHRSMWYSYEPGTKLARDNPGIYSTFLSDGTQNYMGGRGITYVLRDVSEGSRSNGKPRWESSGGAAVRRWSWTGAVDGDTVDVTVMPHSSAYIPYVIVREHELFLPHTGTLSAAQRIAREAYLNQFSTLNGLVKAGAGRKVRSKAKCGSRGHRYEAIEWPEFFAGGEIRKKTRKLAERFDKAAWEVFMGWLASPEGKASGYAPDDFNHHDVTYNVYATLVGHGIGLWDGELFYELGTKRDRSYELGNQAQEWVKREFYTDANAKLIDDLERTMFEESERKRKS